MTETRPKDDEAHGEDPVEPIDVGDGAHVVVDGYDRLGRRTVESLRHLVRPVVVVLTESEQAMVPPPPDDVRIVVGDARQPETLRSAGLDQASALVLTRDDDVGNLHAALAARERYPALRLVVRIYSDVLATQVDTLLGSDARVLSTSALAAPAFVAATLDEDPDLQIRVAGRTLAVRRGPADAPSLVAPLAATTGDDPFRLPADGEAEIWYLDEAPVEAGTPGIGARRRRPPPVTSAGPATLLATLRPLAFDRRLHALILVVATLIVISAVIFRLFEGFGFVDAVYFTVSTITTTGYGDFNLRESDAALKLYAVMLMLTGAAALAVLYALIADRLVSARIADPFGGVPAPAAGHVVVCGLGNVGMRIVGQLVGAGVPVIVVDLRPDDAMALRLRRDGVPVVTGDARSLETLRTVRAAHSRALVAVTQTDAANLETALNARAACPELLIVLRLFEPDLALHIEHAFRLSTTISVAGFAAPIFAAAAVDPRIVGTIPVEDGALVIVESPVVAGAPADGATVGAVERREELRVLGVVSGSAVRWRPDHATVLNAGDALVFVAGPAAFERAVRLTEARPVRVAAPGPVPLD